MKKSFILVVALSIVCVSYALERSAEQAAQIAAQFVNQSAPMRKSQQVSTPTAMTLVKTEMKRQGDAPAYYVFNRENATGFVIVSGDDVAPDVLVYSEDGSFDADDINPNFQFWLNRIQEELSVIDATNAAPRTAVMVQAIAPLLVDDQGQAIAWDQNAPYYNLCPMDDYDKTRCLVGCVATAAAQIMCKWRHPQQGVGSHSYLWQNKNVTSQKETLSVNYGETTYDWDNTLAKYRGTTTAAQKAAAATLSYHCGVACDMRYGGTKAGGSGSWTDIMGYALHTYFSYDVEKFICTLSKGSYKTNKGGVEPANIPCEWSVTTAKFKEYFNTELEAGRPILMGGQDTDGGHEFVCDGRDANGKFHINWGWGGSSNCYCELTALRPSGTAYDFSSSIDAVIGIKPTIIDTIHVERITLAPTAMTIKINQKEQLIATVHPENASIRSFTWLSTNESVARVDETGKVKGIAQGMAYIIATTKDGGYKDTCVVTVTNEILPPTPCSYYSYTFVNKCAKGKNVLGDYEWIISIAAGDVQSIDSEKGQQFGKSAEPAKQVSLSTSDMEDCIVQDVEINACMGKDGDGQIAVYINQQQVGTTQSLTTTNAVYTFENSQQLQGEVEIRLTNTKKALYVKTITINPAAQDVENIEVTTPSRKYMKNGQLIIEYNGVLYNVLGTPISK